MNVKPALNKNCKVFFSSFVLAAALSACSKPDITGVWIPENVSSNDDTYKYYEIKNMDGGTDRLQLIQYYYRIKPAYAGGKVPILLDQPISNVLEFAKDKTYCIEGSLKTQCAVSVDQNTLDIYRSGRFKRSSSNPPKIPVNRYQ